MVNPFYRRPRSQHRLSDIIRRLILIIASILIAYYVLSTFLKGHAAENLSQDIEQSNALSTK
jgi:hypothetical protein